MLLKNADTAMFRSKKAGPGGYLVHTPRGRLRDATASRCPPACARPSSRSNGCCTTSR